MTVVLAAIRAEFTKIISSRVVLLVIGAVIALAVWALVPVEVPSAANPPRRASFAKNSRRGEGFIAVVHANDETVSKPS